MEYDDVQLLARYRIDGDESSFAQLVDRHGPWIHAAARRRLRDVHLADDATQAVFVVLATKAHEIVASKRGSLSAWLFHVMHFNCARLRRTQLRLVLLEESAGLERTKTREAATADGPLLTLLEESVAQLSGLEREIIVRRFYRGQSFVEIGSDIGLSADAARKRSSRAIEQIKQSMLRSGDDAIPEPLLRQFYKPNSRRRGTDTMFESDRIIPTIKEKVAMLKIEQSQLTQGGHQMISVELLAKDVEANLQFFEKLGFPRRFVDKPDDSGTIPRASLTAGHLGKIWIRRADATEIRPSPSINVFFWIDGGPDGLVAYRKKLVEEGIAVTPIIDEGALPNFNVTTPDGYSIAFFTQYVAAGQPPVVLVQ